MSLDIEVDISNKNNGDMSGHKSHPKKLLDLSLRQIGKKWSKNMISILNECSRMFGDSRQPSLTEGMYSAKKIIGKRHRLFYIGITCIFLAIGVFYADISS